MCRGLPFEGPGAPLQAPKPAGAARPQQYDDDFLQFTYKVVPCDKTWRHDYSSCPFAHAGESSERRHPSAYLPFMCCSTQHSTDLKEKCPFGSACKYAHGHFELWLHPGRFRTKMCSLGGNCRRPVCFFAHSTNELRVTPYSKLDTSAAVAAQQLGQLEAGAGGSVATSGSVAGRSVASSMRSSSDGSDLAKGGSPCNSEAGTKAGSPAGSVVCDDGGLAGLAAAAAGMALGAGEGQAAMLEVQLQQGSLAYGNLDGAAAMAAVAAAPAMWLAGGGAVLPQQLPAAAYAGLLPAQQMLLVDAAGVPIVGYGRQLVAAPAVAELAGGGWVLPAQAGRLGADQWAAGSGVLAQQRQQAALSGLGMPDGFVPGCAPVQVQCLPVAGGMAGRAAALDPWAQLDGGLSGPPGLDGRAAVACAVPQPPPQQQPTANARMAQLLSTLPDQAVQQLLGMLTVDG